MSDFSIGDAVGSGFGLIARRPIAVIVWGMVYTLIVILPLPLVGGLMLSDLPAFLKSVQDAAQQGGETAGPPPAFFALQSKMMLLQPLMLLTSLGGRALLTGAIFRGVLEPDNRKFLSLRFGKQELWLALLFLAFGFVIGFGIFLIAIAAVILGFLGWFIGNLAPHPWGGWLGGLLVAADVIGAIVVSFWVVLRLSLAPAITFVDKEFRLFESWSLTKGHVWKLFGLGLILTALAIVIVSIVDGFMFAGVISMFGGFDGDHVRAFFERLHTDPQILVRTLLPRIAVVGVIGLFLTGPLSAIFVAPWATVYRELSRGKAPAHPPVF
jgi:hypothetical protein